ncbi:hypothetical protein [Amycolatopsis carbonis]|uniref:hypothetical protein n=1 Tax=Amycolatopsis carbonis TaxID=715471 RepID=UPI003DA745B1
MTEVAAFAGITVPHIAPLRRDRPAVAELAHRHRRLSEADLDRLQRVLFYRELGFLFETIATTPRAAERREGECGYETQQRMAEL